MSKPPKTLTVLECHQLLDKLLCRKGTPARFRRGVRNYTMAVLMLDAGLRVGEVVQLLESDLMLAGQPMQNLRIRAEISKTKTERIIPLSSRITNAITTMYENWWQQHRNTVRISAFYNISTCQPLTVRQVERIIGHASLAAFGRKVNPHVLRHTFATKLMRVTNARTVQDLLGHKQLSSTQIYTHPNQEDKKKAIEDATCAQTEQNSQKI